MKVLLCILSIMLFLNLRGQQTDIENLVNQIAAIEIPEDFKYYFLIPNSCKTSTINDSTQRACIHKLEQIDSYCPKKIISKKTKKVIHWDAYELNKAVCLSKTQQQTPPSSKTIQFVNYHINQAIYDSLLAHKQPYTLILKKKWFWNKKRISKNQTFQEILIKAWNFDEEQNQEENTYYQFSTPIFSEDQQYAKITIIENQRCTEKACLFIYKNEKGIWSKLLEFELFNTEIETQDTTCGAISIIFNDEDSVTASPKIVKN